MTRQMLTPGMGSWGLGVQIGGSENNRYFSRGGANEGYINLFVAYQKSGEVAVGMGINTLAYQLAQNGAFFACDPDCAAHTEKTPWEPDRQFVDLVARSGEALFVSADPRQVNPEQKAAFRTAMQLALSGGAPGRCEPLDWLDNTTPELWLMGNERVTYHWAEPMGMRSFHL